MNENDEKIKPAVELAKEFLKRAKALQDVLATPQRGWQCKERSALKRCSMDLTRALADLRRRS